MATELPGGSLRRARGPIGDRVSLTMSTPTFEPTSTTTLPFSNDQGRDSLFKVDLRERSLAAYFITMLRSRAGEMFAVSPFPLVLQNEDWLRCATCAAATNPVAGVATIKGSAHMVTNCA